MVAGGRMTGALRKPRVVVVMPAYNAARTLVRTYRDIPPGVVDHVILVDDLSRDDTVAVAELLNLQVVVHRQNLGYGGNQKTCYDTALAEGAPRWREGASRGGGGRQSRAGGRRLAG